MKITKTQLKQIIKEEISRVLSEELDPLAKYERLIKLNKTYNSDWHLLKSIPLGRGQLDDDQYERLLVLRDSTPDYYEFSSAVGTDYDRSTGRHTSNNEFGLSASTARGIHGNPTRDSEGRDSLIRTGGNPVADVKSAWEEYEELSQQFETVNASDATDARYGRRRKNVIYIPTGEVIKSSTNRKGSLGS
tara:strand:- start:149 stop:718 length:570 start_codon:yes stop_codon:yes gene_type:complete